MRTRPLSLSVLMAFVVLACGSRSDILGSGAAGTDGGAAPNVVADASATDDANAIFEAGTTRDAGAGYPACPSHCEQYGNCCVQRRCGPDQCLTDNDCADGGVCSCNAFHTHSSSWGEADETANMCVPANCRIDGDCGPDGSCSPSYSQSCPWVLGYYCHRRGDACMNDNDCGGDAGPRSCTYDTQVGRWACETGSRRTCKWP
jgi:hypothetical protein